jgi:hypothetical protein
MTQARQRRRKSSSLRLPGSVIPPVISSTFRLKQKMLYTDKKKIKIFLIYKEIQIRSGVKSYMTNGLLTYGEKFAHFLIY